MSQQNRLTILHNIEQILKKAGFSIASLSLNSNACFDLIAKRREQLIILKAEPCIDNFDRNKSYELKNIASFLNASPVIISDQFLNTTSSVIGDREKDFCELEDGLVLLRYDIPVICTETFMELISKGVPPIVYRSSRGRYLVHINRKLLRQARLDKNLSYADLAHLVGVSRRTIYEYEHSINPPPATAAKLEEVLDSPIAEGIRIFNIEIQQEENPKYSIDKMSSFKGDISKILQDLGFLSQFWTKLSPFDAFGVHKSQDVHSGLNVLVCVEEDKNKQLIDRVSLTQSIASLTRRRAIMIVEDDTEHPVTQSIPTFTIDELNQMKRAFDLVKVWVKKHSALKEN